MVGRFMDHDGRMTNMPAVRFGHISVILLRSNKTSAYMPMPTASIFIQDRGTLARPCLSIVSPAMILKPLRRRLMTLSVL